MTSSLLDIAPTAFKVQVRSDFPWIPPETINHHCRWLDDALEYVANDRSIDLNRVIAVEFQQYYNGTWTRIPESDLQEAIDRVSQATTGGGKA